MKLSKQQTLKMEYNNCMLEVVDGQLMIIEFSKDGDVVGEYNLLKELEKRERFLLEQGFKVTIVRSISE